METYHFVNDDIVDVFFIKDGLKKVAKTYSCDLLETKSEIYLYFDTEGRLIGLRGKRNKFPKNFKKSTRLNYDCTANLGYIYFTKIGYGSVSLTYNCDPHEAGLINLDFNSEGILLGIELWGAALNQLPDNIIS